MLGHYVLALALVATATMADYVPGNPGGNWTTEELILVKYKINWVIENPEQAMLSITGNNLGPNDAVRFKRKIERTMEFAKKKNNLDSIIPTAAKFVRLTFHDCIKEANTGAGCNGCFNFHLVPTKWYMDGACSGVWRPVRVDFCNKKEFGLRPQIQNETDNNNLLWIGLVLEEIYTKLDYGPFATQSESLFQSGKSRADLWAYAGLVAVQKTIENNNKKCRDDLPAPCLLQVDSSSKSCSLEAGIPSFRTGRSDCIPNCGEDQPNFCTTEMEIHPDPHGNGNKTAEFFADNFGLNVQEAVALLGAHSLGRTHSMTSMFSNKPWTPQGQSDWNNFYYINGVNKTGFRFADPTILGNDINVDQCDLKVSSFTGDEEGKPVPIKFRVKSERNTKNHGPFNWQLFSTGCSDLKCQEISNANGGKYHENSCCHWVDYCKDNQDDCPFNPVNFDSRSENLTPNRVSMNINMLNIDMGWVFDFKTDADGRPYGCPGLDQERWLANRAKFSGEVDCPLNTAPSGLGEDPNGNVRTFFAEFDFYAKNPQKWVDTFTRSYDAMLENGVDTSALTAAPTDWFSP